MATTPASNTKASSLATLPANVLIKRFIPHPDLLPSVDVMITNAGFNSVLTILCHGFLLVCADLSNKADAGALFARCSAGFNLKTNGPTETQIRDAVKTVQHDPKHARQAKKIHDDLAGHDSAAEFCDLIEYLVRRNESLSEH